MAKKKIVKKKKAPARAPKKVKKKSAPTRDTLPDNVDLVTALCLHTAGLEIPIGQFIELAPLPGCCSPFRLSGNSHPVFEYVVFEKGIMEFIHVRVEVARPNRIDYICTISSTSAPELHGKPVQCMPKYREPFEKLSGFLRQYFPFYRCNPMLPNRFDQPKPKAPQPQWDGEPPVPGPLA